MKRWLWIFVLLGVVCVGVLFWLGNKYLGRKIVSNCRVSSFLDKSPVKCGFVRSSEDNSRDYYAGKLKGVKKVGSDYYVLLDVGTAKPLSFLALNGAISTFKVNDSQKTERLRKDQILGLNGKIGDITVSVRPGKRYLEYVKSNKDNFPTAYYINFLKDAEDVAKCDSLTTYLKTYNYVPVFTNCRLTVSEIYY